MAVSEALAQQPEWQESELRVQASGSSLTPSTPALSALSVPPLLDLDSATPWGWTPVFRAAIEGLDDITWKYGASAPYGVNLHQWEAVMFRLTDQVEKDTIIMSASVDAP